MFGVDGFVRVGPARDDGVVGYLAFGVDGGGEDVACGDGARKVGIAHVSGVLRHVDLGERATVVKVGGGAGDEEFGFGGGTLRGGEFGEGEGGIAAVGVAGDSFGGGCWGGFLGCLGVGDYAGAEGGGAFGG